ncbi:hypothetical protein Vadar_000118 [Vaccinium darrowii]|uniref:Uncharacterized protein n=1 Tax=Vaccinium darrowii TaxID=229202 RepID=A0ACB7YSZ6_9ERIC|nr:hypothetical protein Vadar_000118 [Vaccinium darrowii]
MHTYYRSIQRERERGREGGREATKPEEEEVGLIIIHLLLHLRIHHHPSFSSSYDPSSPEEDEVGLLSSSSSSSLRRVGVATKNPYDRTKVAGGSSSGSAAVVSSGLCPAALGVDGGGSVQMLAALCGVVGLKPTFGRVPHSGVLPLNWTVGMVGILAGTVEDAFIVHEAISGQSLSCQPTTILETNQPKVHFLLLKSPNSVSNIKLAKSVEWFNDCTDDIKVCCSRAMDQLYKRYGWETVEVTVPEIEVMFLAHYLTIGSECSTAIACHLEKLNRQMQLHKKIFAKADVIVTPTTCVTAYTLYDDALKTGELDYINGDIKKFPAMVI